MIIRRFVVGTLAVIAPLHACACESFLPDVPKATFVVRGRAMWSHWTEPATLQVRVVVEKTIKGDAPNSLYAISPCELPIEDGESVVVFNIDGELRV